MAKKIVIANWKMNPTGLVEARKLFLATKNKSSKLKKTQVVVCPPSVFLASFHLSKSKLFSLGVQNVFWQTAGAHTGEISVAMIKGFGASYCIVGHSERRFLGESDEMVSKKIGALLKEKITPILCIGEKERDSHGDYLGVLSEQIKRSLASVQKRDIGKVIIAYEPIWTIGKTSRDAMNPHKLHETTLFIEKTLSGMYGRAEASKVIIIYGGSVEPANTTLLIKEGNVSGFLVGHSSLDAERFGEIIKTVDRS